MKTYDGFKAKTCYLKESSIVIDDKSFQLTSLENRTHLKPILWLSLIAVIPLIAFIFPIINEIRTAPDLTDKIVKIFFSSICYIGVFFAGYHILPILTKYRGIWIANGNKSIYIEKSDNIDTESLLAETSRTLIRSQQNKVRKLSATNKLNAISIIFLLAAVFILFTKDISGIQNTQYATISEILVFPFLVLGFFGRIVASIKELKWQ